MEYSVSYDAGRLAETAAMIEQAVRSGAYPSAVLALGNRAGTFWTHVVPGEDGVRLDSIVPIASITKPIVATAVMRLVERGRLLLNDPVAKVIPEFAQNGKEYVTVWHLLTHTSGLDEAGAALQELVARRAPRDAYLEAACASGLRFEPGSQCAYCNLSFVALAELISRLSGQPYPDYLREQIFAPLGMRDTAFAPVEPGRVPAIHGFGKREDMDYFNSLAAPHGGLWSSAADLQTLGRTLLNDGRLGDKRLLSQAAMEPMTRLQTAGLVTMVDGRPQPTYTALGWGKRRPTGVMLASERSFGHSGSTGSFLWIDPDWNLVFVLLSNRWDMDYTGSQQVLNTVYAALEREPVTR